MKKAVFGLVFFLIVMTGFGQQKFFEPISKNMFQRQYLGMADSKQGVILFRPTVGVLATRHTWDKTTKQFNTSPLSAVGIGAGFQHFKQLSTGEPFNDWGVNALLLTDTFNSGMALGIFGSFAGFINLGLDYDFSFKKVSIDTGITLKF